MYHLKHKFNNGPVSRTVKPGSSKETPNIDYPIKKCTDAKVGVQARFEQNYHKSIMAHRRSIRNAILDMPTEQEQKTIQEAYEKKRKMLLANAKNK